MKAMVLLFLSLLALLPVVGWAEQKQFSDWRAEAHVGKLGKRDYGKVRTPTVQGPKHVFLEYDCARFVPMLTAEKGLLSLMAAPLSATPMDVWRSSSRTPSLIAVLSTAL